MITHPLVQVISQSETSAAAACPGSPNPFLTVLLALTLCLAILSLLGCAPDGIDSLDTSETFDSISDESGGDDLGVSISDFNTNEETETDGGPPTTSIVDACCWCEGFDSHCVECASEQLCADESGSFYEHCILVTGAEPFCYEHVCN